MLPLECKAAANIVTVDDSKVFREQDTVFISFLSGEIAIETSNTNWQIMKTDVPLEVKEVLDLRSNKETIVQYNSAEKGIRSYERKI